MGLAAYFFPLILDREVSSTLALVCRLGYLGFPFIFRDFSACFFILAFGHPDANLSTESVVNPLPNENSIYQIQQDIPVTAWDLGKMDLLHVVSLPPLDGT